jgi:hypothetical protein
MSDPALPEQPSRAPSGWLRLQCRPGKADGHLVFPYEVTNTGSAPVLVMDAWKRTLPAGGGFAADQQVAEVTLRADGVVILGKYVPALPPNLRIVVPELPLCRLLNPGDTMQGELRIRLPLAEQTPYLPELRLSGYEPVELKGTIFAIGWWPLAQQGLAAAPAAWAPDHYLVAPLGRLPPAGTAQQRFPTARLEILRRKDGFPRSFPAHPDLEAS